MKHSLVLFSTVFISLSLFANDVKIVDEERYAIVNAEHRAVEADKQAYAQLSSEEKARNDKEANSLAALGIVLFRAGRYSEAVDKFSKSLKLNPHQQTIYLQYGLALMKEKQFKRGIFYVGWDTKSLAIAKYYHIGLAYFRLKNYENSTTILESVKAAKDKKYSPLAASYLGISNFERKKYEPAKGNFEYVLDNSEDPELDRKAEAYIERILRIQQQQNKRAKRYSVGGLLGIQYDSNILFAADGVRDQGVSTDDGGPRYVAAASAAAKAIQKENYDLGASIYTYYVASDERDKFLRADPFLIGANIPYNYRGKLLGKTFRAKVAPGYEVIYLDVNQDKERERILNSALLNTKATFVMNKDWISDYELKLRSDDSNITVTNQADDISAFKSQLFTKQTLVLNKDRAQTVAARAGLTLNSADGDNNNYFRYELEASHNMKLPWWKLRMGNKLRYYNIGYSDRPDDRKDNNIRATFSLSRPITTWVSAIYKLEYTKNASNIDANDYNKWVNLLALSFAHAF